ncbi:MAG: antibiotic biosynthesis monooxygenase [Magnetococcales bacterium]|nr:antibiotic biosynthesis monooxygenase [Magnetococcales bacterium]
MFAVIFEVTPTTDGKKEYLEIAAELRKFLTKQKGFISIERFQSLVDENKILSLSFWQDEEAIKLWRNVIEHRSAQHLGKTKLFDSYRIRVANVVRDYTKHKRCEAPEDSNSTLAGYDKSPDL